MTWLKKTMVCPLGGVGVGGRSQLYAWQFFDAPCRFCRLQRPFVSGRMLAQRYTMPGVARKGDHAIVQTPGSFMLAG
jgi:hypothetical protein